jgi:hypothetical protein
MGDRPRTASAGDRNRMETPVYQSPLMTLMASARTAAPVGPEDGDRRGSGSVLKQIGKVWTPHRARAKLRATPRNNVYAVRPGAPGGSWRCSRSTRSGSRR